MINKNDVTLALTGSGSHSSRQEDTAMHVTLGPLEYMGYLNWPKG